MFIIFKVISAVMLRFGIIPNLMQIVCLMRIINFCLLVYILDRQISFVWLDYSNTFTDDSAIPTPEPKSPIRLAITMSREVSGKGEFIGIISITCRLVTHANLISKHPHISCS